MTVRVIAIDGPAASGKSSTAAAVARALGYVHVDSGALYRAVTWLSLDLPGDAARGIIARARNARVHLVPHDGDLAVSIDGVPDAETVIRMPEVDARVSTVAAVPAVRDWVNQEIRNATVRVAGAVIDGRDIGTVVVPDAALKIYLTATPATRAERRLRQIGDFDPVRLAAEAADLFQRDQRDATRAVAPLRQASDAVVIDTTALAFDEQVAAILDLARSRGLS